MKEFDLEKAKAGHPVCTRIGDEARIICFDRKNYYSPIVALVKNNDTDTEGIFCYDDMGRYNDDGTECSCDLFMKSVKQEKWINIYDSNGHLFTGGSVYDSKKEAEASAEKDKETYSYYKTAKVEWED